MQFQAELGMLYPGIEVCLPEDNNVKLGLLDQVSFTIFCSPISLPLT